MNDFAPETADDVTRALPHAVGPEKAILSCMLDDPQEFLPRAIEAGLNDGHFYLPHHAVLYGFLVKLFDSNQPIEIVSLTQRLLDAGMLDRVGGPAGLADLNGYALQPWHFDHHLRIVRDKFMVRSLIQVATETIASAYDQPDETAELLDATEARIMAIREAGQTMAEETLGATVNRVVDRINAIIRHEPEAAGVSTGFTGMDNLGAFLKPGEMFVVAARPSMGKTAFMMNMVETFAVDHQRNTLVFSAEMTRDSLMQRAICSRAKFPISAIQKGQHTPNKADLQRFQRASIDWASSPLKINDKAQITISEIRAVARRRHREKPLELIAIDYLQYLRSTSKQASFSREREIAEISSGIKALAKELGVPIILLAQLNRDAEKRTGKSMGVPRMSDLRESGAIEQDADMIGLLYREDYYAQDSDTKETAAGRSKLILAKNRNGETGDVPLTFIAPFVRFEDGQPAPELPLQSTNKSRFDDD
ncbi:MAG: replicative DNA helicase [Acidobacteriales bacterium]|nr:replicative DNA helicase [Terriglobales bacterium]